MYNTTDFRRGLKIELDGDLWQIVEFQHVNPGKGGAFVRTRLKNLQTGQSLERTFRAGEKVGKPDFDERAVQYLYREDDQYHFMDTRTFEQFFVPEAQLGDNRLLLKESLEVDMLMFKGRPVNIDFPTFVNYAVTQAEPGVRGDTASGGTKPVTIETGLVVQVPFHISEGDVIKVDTRTGEYVEKMG